MKHFGYDEQIAWQRQCIMEDYQDTGGHGFGRFEEPHRIGAQVSQETRLRSVRSVARMAAQAQKAPRYALAD